MQIITNESKFQIKAENSILVIYDSQHSLEFAKQKKYPNVTDSLESGKSYAEYLGKLWDEQKEVFCQEVLKNTCETECYNDIFKLKINVSLEKI